MTKPNPLFVMLYTTLSSLQACHEAAVQRYVAWSLGYEFPELTNFFARLEDLIAKVRI